MLEIHRVTDDELVVLLTWLEKHLPLTWKLYGTLREQLRGRWQGTTFITLGWPDILAVGEGPIDQNVCKVVEHYTDPRRTTVFAPDPTHVEELLMWPGFLDWSEPIIFHTLSSYAAPVVERLSQKWEGSTRTVPLTLLTVNPGEITYRPSLPPDLLLQRLDPNQDAAFVVGHWEYAGKHTESYVKELLNCFPSLGVFTRDGCCLGTEMGTEWGFMGMLYITPQARGQGLGKLLTCRLADKYFEEDLPAVVITSVANLESISMHEKLGFTQKCRLNLVYYTPKLRK